MKPYSRKNEPVKGAEWKKDYHCHNKNSRKVGSWWEDMSNDGIDRGAIKQRIKKEIENEIDEFNRDSDMELRDI